jgi:hypothetical protein
MEDSCDASGFIPDNLPHPTFSGDFDGFCVPAQLFPVLFLVSTLFSPTDND